MTFASARTTEVTRLRVREFNKITVKGGVRLLKCEACGQLTDRGMIIDRDITEERAPGEVEKTGYERWVLCPGCSEKILEKVNTFTDKLIEDIQKIKKS